MDRLEEIRAYVKPALDRGDGAIAVVTIEDLKWLIDEIERLRDSRNHWIDEVTKLDAERSKA